MVLSIKDLRKVYSNGVVTEALKGINLSVNRGEFIGIMGPSGSGKTSLLNIIATVDKPTTGEMILNGQNPHSISKSMLAKFRRKQLGIVFQDFNLLDTLSVRENIALPMILDKINYKTIELRLQEVAKYLGISDLLDKHPYEISGGEAQRTAIARAVINEPSLLLADEPTGNLDSKASDDVMNMFAKLNEEECVTTIVVTHDPMAACFCNRVIFIKDGVLYNEIYKGDNRNKFYNEILDMLSFLNTAE